jgi:hypothetical protein
MIAAIASTSELCTQLNAAAQGLELAQENLAALDDDAAAPLRDAAVRLLRALDVMTRTLSRAADVP